MNISDDPFDDTMSCTRYDIPCQLLGDDIEEVLDGSQDQDLSGLSIDGK